MGRSAAVRWLVFAALFMLALLCLAGRDYCLIPAAAHLIGDYHRSTASNLLCKSCAEEG